MILWPRGPHCRPLHKEDEKGWEPAPRGVQPPEKGTPFSREVTALHRPSLPLPVVPAEGFCCLRLRDATAGYEHMGHITGKGGSRGRGKTRRDQPA